MQNMINRNSIDESPAKDEILGWLKTVIDPEAGINIVDMGLIYDVRWVSNKLTLIMTMTSPACPVGDMLVEEVESCLRSHMSSETDIEVEISFNPLWDPSMMSEVARQSFGW